MSEISEFVVSRIDHSKWADAWGEFSSSLKDTNQVSEEAWIQMIGVELANTQLDPDDPVFAYEVLIEGESAQFNVPVQHKVLNGV